MKKLSFILLGFVIVLGACQKGSIPQLKHAMSAKVGKELWSSSHSDVSLQQGVGTGITIVADSADTKCVLSIGKYTGPGTYSLVNPENAAAFTNTVSGAGNITHTASSGKIVVTDNFLNAEGMTEIKGTFEFLGDTLSVVNGAFDVSFNLD